MWVKEKVLVTSISPFPIMFSKVFFPRVHKSRDCVVKSEAQVTDNVYPEPKVMYIFKEDEDSPMRTKLSKPNFNQSEQNLHSAESSMKRSASKQELLETKQDLLSLKQDLHKLKKSLIEPDPNSVDSDDFQDFESYESQQVTKQTETPNLTDTSKPTSISHSGTSDSIAEGQFKSNTPSMISSGYGSQAVSTLTLSSEDSLSLRSNDDSESNKFSKKSGFEHASSGESDGDENGHNLVTAISGIQEESLGDLKNVGIEISTDSNIDSEDTVGDKQEELKITDKVSMKSSDSESEKGTENDKILHISEEDLRSVEGEQKLGAVLDVDVSNNVQSNLNEQSKKLVGTESADETSGVKKNDCLDTSMIKKDSQVLEESRDSESSVNVSRGPLHSDSIDPYSLEAMEELERLGDEFGPDNSDFISMDESLNSSSRKTTPNIAKGLDTSLTKCDIKPSDQSTPKRRDRKGSDGRDRPVSCIVTSKNDLLESSMGERNKRSSLDISDEHLSGRIGYYRS